MAFKINHLHLKTPDPQKTVDWYVKYIGAEVVSERGLSGVGAAHTVRTGTGWRGGRADVHAGHTGVVRGQRHSWPEYQLAKVLGAGHDVAADKVGVV